MRAQTAIFCVTRRPTLKHYGKLHPNELSALHRQSMSFDLKDIGYQVGSAWWWVRRIRRQRILFLTCAFAEAAADMIPASAASCASQTPFANEKSARRADTAASLNIAFVVSRAAFAPTADWRFGTIHLASGRELGLKAGETLDAELAVRGKLYEPQEQDLGRAAQCRGRPEQRVKFGGL